MSVAIFEDDRWPDFRPISTTRHLGQQIVGRSSLIEQVAERVDDGVSLWGRKYLTETVREKTRLPYGEAPDGSVLAINARINPLVDFEKMTARRSDFVLLDRGEVAIAILNKVRFEKSSSPDGTMPQSKLNFATKGLERLESANPMLYRYPWEMIASNDAALERKSGRRGPKRLDISPSAEVEKFVTFDPSGGRITVGEGARIESFSRISGPCYVGPKTVVHSALIGAGTTIGEDCRIGGEVQRSIVYPHTNKAHFGYLGHSIVGEWVNLGAGSTTSDLKSTYGTIRVERTAGRIDSGLVKLGPMVGDMAKVAIGTMIQGGRSVGVSAHCAGVVDRDVPDFTSYDGHKGEAFRLTLRSVSETQERMMARRGPGPSRDKMRLIRRLFAVSQGSRG